MRRNEFAKSGPHVKVAYGRESTSIPLPPWPEEITVGEAWKNACHKMPDWPRDGVIFVAAGRRWAPEEVLEQVDHMSAEDQHQPAPFGFKCSS